MIGIHGVRIRRKSFFSRFLKTILTILLLVVLAAAGGVTYLTVTEYNPPEEEALEVSGAASGKLSAGEELTFMTWNIGYAALGKNADFFMDGGTHSITSDQAQVENNLDGIISGIESVNPDVLFIQEIDTDSKRSWGINEVQTAADYFSGYDSVFACNYKCNYIPYPIPTLGKVNSGIMTFSKFPIEESKRVSLPTTKEWPVRVAFLKRCLEISYIPVEGSDKQLALINLHLEAYDSGAGQAVQTQELMDAFEEELKKGNYVIAGGDFNQSFSNIDTDQYKTDRAGLWEAGYLDVSDFDSSLSFLMDNTTPTCRSLDQPYEGADTDTFQYYMLDGWIVSSNIKVDKVTTLDMGFENSDHNPVVMTLELEE